MDGWGNGWVEDSITDRILFFLTTIHSSNHPVPTRRASRQQLFAAQESSTVQTLIPRFVIVNAVSRDYIMTRLVMIGKHV